MKQIQFREAVEMLQKMIDGKITSSLQIEYEVYAGNPEGKRTLQSRYDVVDGGVVYGFPGSEIPTVSPAAVKETEWFEKDFGARLTDTRYATCFYLVD